MTKDLRKDLEKYLKENPDIAKLLKAMQKSQADYIRIVNSLGSPPGRNRSSSSQHH